MAKLKNTARGIFLHTIRYALSGQDSSPPPWEIAYIIGKEETLKRLNYAISILNG